MQSHHLATPTLIVTAPQNDLDLLTALIKKRETADILWEEAVYSGEDAAAEEKYQLAHNLYIECHQLLSKFLESKSGVENLLRDAALLYATECEKIPVIIGLYFTAKTLADAYFAQNEFVEAHPLYLLSATLLKSCFKNESAKNWLMTVVGDMDGIYTNIKYNSALCILYYFENITIQDQQHPFDQDQIDYALNQLIDYLKELRLSDVVTTTEINTVVQNVLRARIMFNNAPISFHSARHMDYLKWCMQSILEPFQIGKLVKMELASKIDFFELLNNPVLKISAEQQTYINTTILGKADSNKVTKHAIQIAQELKTFSESKTYERFTLKEHQKTAFNLTMKHFAEGQTKAGVTMATGSGKTRVYITQLLAMYHNMPIAGINKKRTLIVVPQLSLSEQTTKRIHELVQLSGLKIKVAQFNGQSKKQSQITIISLQSLVSEMKKQPNRRKLDLDLYAVVVFDEIHEALTEICKSLIAELEKSKIILTFTATDTYNTVRRKGNLKSVSELIGDENCIYRYPLLQGINEKILAPLRVCVINGLKQIPQRKQSSLINKEFNLNEMGNELAKDDYHEINATIAELYLNLSHPDSGEALSGKQTFIFCVNVQHAKILAKLLSQYNVSAAAISGDMNQNLQNDLLDKFQANKLNVLCCADLLITGIDVRLDVIINARPTKSMVLAEQRLGRVTRPAPGKICGLVIEIMMSEGQILATTFINKQWYAGELKVLAYENTQFKREEVDKGRQIPGACNWVLSWDRQMPKQQVIMPANLVTQVGFFTQNPLKRTFQVMSKEHDSTIGNPQDRQGMDKKYFINEFNAGSIIEDKIDEEMMVEEKMVEEKIILKMPVEKIDINYIEQDRDVNQTQLADEPVSKRLKTDNFLFYDDIENDLLFFGMESSINNDFQDDKNETSILNIDPYDISYHFTR